MNECVRLSTENANFLPSGDTQRCFTFPRTLNKGVGTSLPSIGTRKTCPAFTKNTSLLFGAIMGLLPSPNVLGEDVPSVDTEKMVIFWGSICEVGLTGTSS